VEPSQIFDSGIQHGRALKELAPAQRRMIVIKTGQEAREFQEILLRFV
jgi:hypothetical protein